MSDQTRGIGDILQSDIEATVKFFDPQKGFGFVELCTGAGDAYLPGPILEEAGYRNLKKGTVLFCEVRHGQRGAEVSAIHFIDLATGGGEAVGRNGSAAVSGDAPRIPGGAPRPQASPRPARRRSPNSKPFRKKEEPTGSAPEPAGG